MDLVRVSYAVEFSQALAPWLELRNLFRAAGDNPAGEVEGQPIVIARPEVRQRVTLSVRALAVEQESADGETATWDPVISRVRTVAGASPLPDIQSTRLTGIWIQPFDLPFSELVARLRDRLFVPTPMATASTDLSAIYEERTGDHEVLSVQVGPMAPQQLNRDYVVFAREGLPTQFAFLSITRHSQEASAFSTDRLVEEIAKLNELSLLRTDYVRSLLEV